MNLKLVQAPHREPAFAEASIPAHPEYPIQRAFGSDDPVTQQQLMQLAARGTPEPDHTLFVADCNGLLVLARSESPLNRVADVLRQRFGANLLVGLPVVRHAHGVPVLEPYMVVLVNAPASYLPAVRKDLVARRGRITRLVERSSFVLEGEAPLTRLLGYHERMREILGDSWGECHVATWLSRYVPADGDGPAAA